MHRSLSLFIGTCIASGQEPVASECADPAVKYWALDTPNNECAEACLSTKIQISEFGVLTGFKGKAAGNESSPCADHSFHSFKSTDVLGVGPIKISLDKYLPDGAGLTNGHGPVALVCTAPAVKYWALDTPNNECAETCLSTKIQISEFGVLTGFKGKAAGNEASPCAEHHFHSFKSTDVLGVGPIKISLDKYLPDGAGLEVGQEPVASICSSPAVKYWALDTPNNECAETCLSTEIQQAEFQVFTFFKGQEAGNESSPCAAHDFHNFKATHVFGTGPIKISMDKYLPDEAAKEILV